MSHDDYPNDATTTGRLSLGVTISGQFDEPHSFFDEYFRDEDWFRLSATAGESYLVYGYGFALDMQVVGDFEPADGTIEVNGFSKPDISERVLVFTANKTRDYFVQVSNSITSESGSYELLAWQYEIPDSPVTSMTLVDGVTKTHRLETVIDVDYFKMPMVAGKTYEIRLEGFTDYFDFSDSFLPQLKILDPDNNLLEDKRVFARNKVARFEFTPTQTATYFAAVDANGLGGVGTYDIRKLELVDTAATGPSTTSRLDLKPNQTAAITSNFGPGDDIDWHQVDLVAGRWYQFGVVSDFSLVWMLLDRNNDLIEYRVGDQQHMFFRAAETGTHHLLLRDGVSDYTLYGVDNAAPPISLSSPYRNPVELLGNASITGQELFSLNEFPADQIQIVSEADFMVGTTKYDRYLLHSFPANELASLRFEGALQRGEYDVSLRALGGGTHSGWAQAVISSRPDNSDLLDSGHLWTADNTQRNRVYQLTYRFADSVPSYFEDGRFTGFQPISSTVEDIFREMFARSSGLHDKTITGYGNQISTITGKSIIYDDSEDADIQIFTADADIRAIGYHPGKYGLGDIVLDNDFYAGEAAPQPGSREYFEIVKAVATALGVKHFAHEFNREQSIVGTATYGISDDAIYPTTFGNQDISFFDSRFGWSRDTTPTVDVTEYKLGQPIRRQLFSNAAPIQRGKQYRCPGIRVASINRFARRRQKSRRWRRHFSSLSRRGTRIKFRRCHPERARQRV